VITLVDKGIKQKKKNLLLIILILIKYLT